MKELPVRQDKYKFTKEFLWRNKNRAFPREEVFNFGV